MLRDKSLQKNWYLYEIINYNDTRQKRKNRRMRSLSAVFFKSFLVGKFRTFKQNLLTESMNKDGAGVLWTPIFFLSLLAGILKFLKSQ